MAEYSRVPAGDVDAYADVDVVVLTRDGSPPPAPVRAAVARQQAHGVRVRLHVVAGTPRPDDPNRWATIARARNAGRRAGSAPWVMFLDDDVVPADDCLARLVDALNAHPRHAAMAVDLLGESDPDGLGLGLPSAHIGMGAVMFRREVLAFLRFRWEPGKCECRCCADDLRRAGFGIDYCTSARGLHVPSLTDPARGRDVKAVVPPARTQRPPCPAALPEGPPRVIGVFDRAHFGRFRHSFLASFRASGNPETVVALAYGLRPDERRILASLPGVEAHNLPMNDVHPAARRMADLQAIVRQWPEGTPAAYWDVGDVTFQGRVAPLWQIARSDPGRVLVVQEPTPFLKNRYVWTWVLSIADPSARRVAFDLHARNPYLNGGFAGGTARALRAYLYGANAIRQSRVMAGSNDWSDQTAMNLYCHADPARRRVVSERWNFCLYARPTPFEIAPDGRLVVPDGRPVTVVHGNGKSAPWRELSHLVSG